MRRLLLGPLVLVTLLINPAIFTGCGGPEDTFSYGEADMLNAVMQVAEEEWRLQESGTTHTLTFALEQGETLHLTRRQISVFAQAYACGQRTFVREASACTDFSALALQGKVKIQTPGNNERDTVINVQGSLTSHGRHLHPATLHLTHSMGEFTLVSDEQGQFELRDARW